MDQLDNQIQTLLAELAAEGYGVSKVKLKALKRDIKFGLNCGETINEAMNILDEEPGWWWYGIEYPEKG